MLIVGQAVDVLLALELIVKLEDEVEDFVIAVLRDDVLEMTGDLVYVGLLVLVLDDVAVLDIEAEPVIVFELVIEGVRVEVVLIVFVMRGDREADEDALEVLEPRTDAVSEGEELDVLD